MRVLLFTETSKFCVVVIFCCSLFTRFSSCSSLDIQEIVQKNYLKWEKMYLDWLTPEQKAKLNELKNQGATVDDLHSALMAMYDSVESRTTTLVNTHTLVQANKALLSASLSFVTFLAEPLTYYVDEFDRITGTASHPYTVAEQHVFAERIKQRLNGLAGQLIRDIDDEEKFKLAKKYLPSCVKVLLSTSRMIREMVAEQESHLIDDSDIAKWTDRYLSWLDDSEKRQLKSLQEEGASFDELRGVIEEFHSAANGSRLVQANRLLTEGCTALMEYLMGKDKAASYIAFAKDFASDDENAQDQIIDLFSSIEPGLKQHIARSFLDSCDNIFEAASDTEGQKVHRHDEI